MSHVLQTLFEMDENTALLSVDGVSNESHILQWVNLRLQEGRKLRTEPQRRAQEREKEM